MLRAAAIGLDPPCALRVVGQVGGDDHAVFRDALRLLRAALPGVEIAAAFALSPKAVDKHRENLMRKRPVNRSAQRVRKVRELGLPGDPA